MLTHADELEGRSCVWRPSIQDVTTIAWGDERYHILTVHLAELVYDARANAFCQGYLPMQP